MNVSERRYYSIINAFKARALKVLHLIEEDMMEFAEENGVDMSLVRDEINKHDDS